MIIFGIFFLSMVNICMGHYNYKLSYIRFHIFLLLQFALLHFALIPTQNIITQNVKTGVYYNGYTLV